MEVDSVVIIAMLSMSYNTTGIVKTYTSVAKILGVPVENQITTLSVVKIAIKLSPCRIVVKFKNKNIYGTCFIDPFRRIKKIILCLCFGWIIKLLKWSIKDV